MCICRGETEALQFFDREARGSTVEPRRHQGETMRIWIARSARVCGSAWRREIR